MTSRYLPRAAEPAVARLRMAFPVLALTGPRQSGKTTLARRAFPDKPYRSLEDLETRRLAQVDPRGFLAQFPDGAVLDEVQRAPDLLSYLQGVVDADGRMGLFVVTGSQQFGLLDKITQSLAGRVGLVELLPLSWGELSRGANGVCADIPLAEALWRGGYPALHDAARTPALRPEDWFRAYVSTYVERDVRQVLAVRDLASFERFVLMCAARSGQLLNVQSLAADCGISTHAARQWISVLEASYVLRLLRPWHENFGKRLVKMPKLYFLDSGLLCWLLRIQSPQALATHAMRGAIFEGWVLAETLKHRWNQALPADLYFWRDNHGVEIDLVYPHEGLLHPVEIKSGATFVPEWTDSCKRLAKYAGARAAAGVVVYGGDRRFDFQGTAVMPWSAFGASAAA